MIDKTTLKKKTAGVLNQLDAYIDTFQRGRGMPPKQITLSRDYYETLKSEASTNPSFRKTLEDGTYRGVKLRRPDQ